MNSFELFLIAHLIADFLLQNNWMALNKSKRVIPLTVHLVIYGSCICIAFPTLTWEIAVILVLHGLVDSMSLADKWLRLIRGRSFKSVQKMYDVIRYKSSLKTDEMVYVGFTCLVYAVVDFLIHFLTTYPIIYWVLNAS